MRRFAMTHAVEVAYGRRRAWLPARVMPELLRPREPGGVRLLPPHDPYPSLRDRATVLSSICRAP